MKLKWTDKEIDYFRKSAKQTDDDNQWGWWVLFAAVIIMEVIVIAKFIGAF